jgi:hypothetical protein
MVLFMASHVLRREKIELSSSIKQYPNLIRFAKEACRDQRVQQEMNHLIFELSKNNLECGLGSPVSIGTKGIFYLRGRNGARLFYRQTKNGYDIVGKASKNNEEQVVKALLKIYG